MPPKTAKSGSDAWFEDLTLRPRAPAPASSPSTKSVRTSKSLAPARRVSKEPPPKDKPSAAAAAPAPAAVPSAEDPVTRYVRTTYRTDLTSLRSSALKDVLRKS
eukprot:jgi/Mesvir1/10372/Mv10572-RA.1